MASHRNKVYRQILSAASDSRSTRTRAVLRDALLRLLKNIPLEQIGIRDIAAAADVGYATFYRHYPTKDALLGDIAAVEVQSLIQLVLPLMNVKDSLTACEGLFEYAGQRRHVWLILLAGGAAGAFRQALLNTALEVAAAWPAEAPSPNALSREARTRLLVSGAVEVLAWWLSDPARPSVRIGAEVLSRVVVQPALSSPQHDRVPALRAQKPPVKRTAKNAPAKTLRRKTPLP